MAKFLDYHPTLPMLTPDAVDSMIQKIQSHSLGNTEVTEWNIYVGMTGQAWCLCEAPDPGAVYDAHELLGFPQREENVVEVAQLV